MKISNNSSLKLIILSISILMLFTSCTKKDVSKKGGGSPKNISESEIYPLGSLKRAKFFDSSNDEIIISLSENDISYIINNVKESKKDLVSSYENDLIELNLSFTDSIIQLIRLNEEIVYYVFHNSEVNAICYKVQSKDLSEFISKIIN